MSLLHLLHKLHSPKALATLLAMGAATGYFAPHFTHSLHWILHTYETLLAMVILPFIIAAVTLSFRRLFHMGNARSMTLRVAGLMLLMIALIALLGTLVGTISGPGRNLPHESLVAFNQLVIAKATGDTLEFEAQLAHVDEQAESFSIRQDIFGKIIPSNFFAALSENASLKIIVFCIFLGIAVGVTHRNTDDMLSRTFEGIYGASAMLVSWITHAIPIMAFIAIATAVSTAGIGVVYATIKFILIFSITALLLSALFSWFVMVRGRLTAKDFSMAFYVPALQVVATQSVVAGVPHTIDAMSNKLKFDAKMVELLIPLYATLLRAGPALYFSIALVFVAQMYEVHIGPTEMLLIALGSLVAAFSSAGAQGAVIISFGAIACEYVNLPFEAAMIFFIAIDEICDAPRSLLNLTASAACTALLATYDTPFEKEPELEVVADYS